MEFEKSVPIWVPPHPEVMSTSYVAYVPNHMKYTSQVPVIVLFRQVCYIFPEFIPIMQLVTVAIRP